MIKSRTKTSNNTNRQEKIISNMLQNNLLKKWTDKCSKFMAKKYSKIKKTRNQKLNSNPKSTLQ